MENTPQKYCVECGTQLVEVGDFKKYWFSVLNCPKCSGIDYLEVAHAKNIYPLQRLELGIRSSLLSASAKEIEDAVKKLQFYDHKTVSIVAFENHLRNL